MVRQEAPLNKRTTKLARRIQRAMDIEARKAVSEDHPGRCPHCGTLGDQHPWGRCDRWLRMNIRGRRCDIELHVPRLICGACKRTYGILGPGIVPYRWYSLTFILETVSEHLLSSKSVYALCRDLRISRSTLYRWLKIARAHFRLLRGCLKGTDRNLAKLRWCWRRNSYLRTFLHRYHRVFLEHLRN